MQLDLNYGRDHYPLELPDDWDVTVIRKPVMPLEPDPAGAVRKALAQPVGASPLANAARGLKSACILICDITRPVPNGLFLPEIVRQLLDAGMKPGAITVLVATGLHRPNEGAELEELAGDPGVLKTVRVVNHFARDDSAHVDLGRTPRGTPVKLDRRFVEADLKIATGLVEPHFMAGYSGGRKVIAPGVAHRDTITTFHSARFMSHPKADNCILEGNPLHEEPIAIVRMLGSVLSVNPVIDEHRRLSFFNSCPILQTHPPTAPFPPRSPPPPTSR